MKLKPLKPLPALSLAILLCAVAAPAQASFSITYTPLKSAPLQEIAPVAVASASPVEIKPSDARVAPPEALSEGEQYVKERPSRVLAESLAVKRGTNATYNKAETLANAVEQAKASDAKVIGPKPALAAKQESAHESHEKAVKAKAELQPDETFHSPPPVRSWIVSPSDGTMRVVLSRWANTAGWQLVWDANVDVPLSVSADFQGEFRDAVKALFHSLTAADVNLNAMLYNGNRVLRVTEIGRRSQ